VSFDDCGRSKTIQPQMAGGKVEQFIELSKETKVPNPDKRSETLCTIGLQIIEL
jgi:hypothetical protein